MFIRFSIVFILVFGLLALPAKAQLEDLEIDRLRFGVQASPVISFMYANDNQINSDGINLGLKLGLMAEYYFSETYAITSGLNMAFNHGGPMIYEVGGTFLPDSELSEESLREVADGTRIKYNLQYLEIPLGLKMRTEEFGYIRYFAEMPIFHLNILTRARGDIDGPEDQSENENISRDATFFNLTWGFGGGFEYSLSPNSSIVTGLYYHQSFVDITDDSGQKNNGRDENSKGSFGLIQLRVGILF